MRSTFAENLSSKCLKQTSPEAFSYSSALVRKSLIAFFPLIMLLLVVSCASSPTAEDKRNAETYNNLGYAYLNDGQLNEAYLEFQKSIAIDPGNKETLNYLGYISTRFKKYDEAIAYYKRAIAIDPGYADAMHNLGVTYADMEAWDEAIKCFKSALSNPMYGTPAQAYSNLGYAYYKKGDIINAEKSLKDALLRNPVSPMAMYILGLVYLETKNEKAAVEEFKRAIGILPDYADAHWELAKVYLKSGQKARALKHFEVVAEKDGNVGRRREALLYIQQLKYKSR
ncbi:MAG: tetratricopeptide repeat protein [Nitrospirota bacterium]